MKFDPLPVEDKTNPLTDSISRAGGFVINWRVQFLLEKWRYISRYHLTKASATVPWLQHLVNLMGDFGRDPVKEFSTNRNRHRPLIKGPNTLCLVSDLLRLISANPHPSAPVNKDTRVLKPHLSYHCYVTVCLLIAYQGFDIASLNLSGAMWNTVWLLYNTSLIVLRKTFFIFNDVGSIFGKHRKIF